MNIRERLNEIRAHLEAIERELKPDAPIAPWHEAPEWAMWAAMDLDGAWWWFDAEPEFGEEIWVPQTMIWKAFTFAQHPNWTQSKQRRPE